MKLKFLHRIEPEKGKEIKVIFTVPVGNKEVFALERGKEYHVCDTSGQTSLKLGPVKSRPSDAKCGNCKLWQRPEDININGLCNRTNESSPIYHWCSSWEERV